MRYVFNCNNKKDNPDFPCDIHLHEHVATRTEIFPMIVEDSRQLEYGYVDYIDSEVICYYCSNCNTEFTYEEVLELIGEEEE